MIALIALLCATALAQLPILDACNCPLTEQRCKATAGKTWLPSETPENDNNKVKRSTHDKRCLCEEVKGGVCCEQPICLAFSCVGTLVPQTLANGCATCPKCEPNPQLPSCRCPFDKKSCDADAGLEWIPKTTVLPAPSPEKRSLHKRCSCTEPDNSGVCCTRRVCPETSCGLGWSAKQNFDKNGCRLCDTCEKPILPPCNCPTTQQQCAKMEDKVWVSFLVNPPQPQPEKELQPEKKRSLDKRCSCVAPDGKCCSIPGTDTPCPQIKCAFGQYTPIKNGCPQCPTCKPQLVTPPPCFCPPHDKDTCDKKGGNWMVKATLPFPAPMAENRKRCSCVAPENGVCCFPTPCAPPPDSCPPGQSLKQTTHANGCPGCLQCQQTVITPPCQCPVPNEKACKAKGADFFWIMKSTTPVPDDNNNDDNENEEERKRCSCLAPDGVCCESQLCPAVACGPNQVSVDTELKNGCPGCPVCKAASPPGLPTCNCPAQKECPDGEYWMPEASQTEKRSNGKRCTCVQLRGKCCPNVVASLKQLVCESGEPRDVLDSNGCPTGKQQCATDDSSCQCAAEDSCDDTQVWIRGASNENADASCQCDGACCASLTCPTRNCANGVQAPTNARGCPICCSDSVVDTESAATRTVIASLSVALIVIATLL